MKPEEKLVREYFGDPDGDHTEDEIMKTDRMMEHMNWHKAPENKGRTGNYGERFLIFHEQYIEKFDKFRISKGFLRVSSWDPSTPIPTRLAHDIPLMTKAENPPKGGLRDTDNPYSVDALCKTPSWLTFSGGSDTDPLYGHRALWQFKSLEELGRAIDYDWHIRVHNTMGGDVSRFHSPIDPIFWPWHKWIDEIRANWVSWERGLITIPLPGALDRVARLSKWFVLAESNEISRPLESIEVSKPIIDAFLALGIDQISHQISDPKSRDVLRRTSVDLLSGVVKRIAPQSSQTEAK